MFDPLNFTKGARVKDVRRWRESELVHGRVAMLAALGFIVGEQLEDFPAFYNADGHIAGPAIYQFQQVEARGAIFVSVLVRAGGLVLLGGVLGAGVEACAGRVGMQAGSSGVAKVQCQSAFCGWPGQHGHSPPRCPASKPADDQHLLTRRFLRLLPVAPPQWEPLILAIGLCESYRVALGWATPTGEGFNSLKDEYNMGDLG
jgi:hypothetical protein